MAQPVLDRALAVATRHVPAAARRVVPAAARRVVPTRRALATPAPAPVTPDPAPARAHAAPVSAAPALAPDRASVSPLRSPADPRDAARSLGAQRENRVGTSAPTAADRSAPDAERTPVVHVGAPAYGVRTVEARPESESGIAVAARTADVIRLGFSVAVPSVGALARVAALVEDALAEVGRDRSAVRVLLDLEVVLAGDERTARRKRSHLEYLDALAGLSWAPADTRVVTTADRLVAEVGEVARRAGVDGVVLHPLAGGAEVEAELRALVA